MDDAGEDEKGVHSMDTLDDFPDGLGAAPDSEPLPLAVKFSTAERRFAVLVARGADPIVSMQALGLSRDQVWNDRINAEIERLKALEAAQTVRERKDVERFLLEIIQGPYISQGGTVRVAQMVRDGRGFLVKRIKPGKYGRTYEFHDPIRAAHLLAKLKGWVVDEKVDHHTLIQQVVHLYGEVPPAKALEDFKDAATDA